jgi:hydrogenase expression/formation protein HypC
MCLAVPSRVVATDGQTATVEAFGQRRRVSLMLLEGPVQLGDYLLVQAGGHAFERVDPQTAQAALALMQEIVSHDRSDGFSDLRSW